MIPPITAVLAAAFDLVRLESFNRARLITGRSFFLGMGLAIVIGIPTGALIGFGALFELDLRGFLMERFRALVLIIFAFVLVEAVGHLERRIRSYASAR